MSLNGLDRAVLLILIWSLLLEILTIVYFIASSQTFRFEFGLTVFLLIITLPPIIFLVRKIAKTNRPL
ncbi:MAG: hypothetical protein RMI79_03060 [Nitrososphaerota archaeon]|nr:hypothetical protein [Nitrososphaerota archaeon]